MEISIGIADEIIPSVVPMEISIGNNLTVPMEISIGIADELIPSVLPMENSIGKSVNGRWNPLQNGRWNYPTADLSVKFTDGIIPSAKFIGGAFNGKIIPSAIPSVFIIPTEKSSLPMEYSIGIRLFFSSDLARWACPKIGCFS
ncbi:hypothetical protein CASFOL_019235 [Castilleja foliolosa]|uniref:Uncharacterized protein n=1 Tax=Castilleja foliolosa TaxID=1961234 RepID=A0ABD3D3T2_9LAMI